ncbi:MAG: SPFH domain-containing protein [Anaerolineae bacterium]
MSQNSQQESTGDTGTRRTEEFPGDPIGCYLPILLVILVLAFGAYLYIVMYLPILSGMGGPPTLLDKLLLGLHIPLGALFSWMVSGIIICLLLLLWFRLPAYLKPRHTRIVFAIVLGIVAIWWIAGLVGHLEGAEPNPMFEFIVGTFFRLFLLVFGIPTDRVMSLLPTFSVIALAAGILVLPALWCRRSMIGPFVLPFWGMLGFWLLWCLALIWGMGEWRVGIELFVSMAMTLLLFRIGLPPASGSLFPLPGREHWGKALGFLQDWILGYNYPGYVVVDELYEEDRVEERVPGNRFRQLGDAPGFIIIDDCHYAVAVSAGTKFKGVKGPGVIFTGYADQVMQTVDLRPQLRAFPVEAVTKDGIPIKTVVFTPCKIDSRGRPPQLGEHLAYSPAAGFKAIRAQEMRHEGPGQTPDSKKRYRWEELSRSIATRILQDIISRYKFDDLYGPYQSSDNLPRKAIAQELTGRLRDELKEMGIELVGGGVSDLQPAAPEVYEKRAENWKEEWEHRIALQKTESQTELIEMVERVRLEAQAELILDMGRRLEASLAETELHHPTAVRQFVMLLDELMRQQPTLKDVIPEKTAEALMELRDIIG